MINPYCSFIRIAGSDRVFGVDLVNEVTESHRNLSCNSSNSVPFSLNLGFPIKWRGRACWQRMRQILVFFNKRIVAINDDVMLIPYSALRGWAPLQCMLSMS